MKIVFERNKWVSFVLALMLLLSFVLANKAVFAQDDKDIQDSITSIQKKLNKEQAAKAALELQLSKIQGSVNATQQEILKTQALIKETENAISRKESEIAALEKKNNFQKIVLTGIIREMYYAKKTSAVDVMVGNDDFSGVLGNIDHALSLEQKIFEMIDEIKGTQEQVLNDKEELAVIKEEHEKTLEVKQDIKQDLDADKMDVIADIQTKEKTISQLNEKLNELRNEYSRILGKSISTDDIVKAAEFASKATGMNKSFLLAILIQESNKGLNVGTGTYKKDMNKDQRSTFEAICKELGYNPSKMPVSKRICYKSGCGGGAMGVGQFMPKTWLGYKSRVAALTGHNPPDPWSLVDGVVAMASKLSNDGANKKTRFYEAKSYCVYLAGGNWGYYCFGSDKYKKSYEDINCWGTSIRNYGEKVLCLKDNYEKYY